MPKEPDNLMLKLLREIRDKQDELRASQNEQGNKIDKLTTDLEELRSWTVHALGVVTTHHLKNQEQDARLDDLARKLEKK
jgi:hypothetical protein